MDRFRRAPVAALAVLLLMAVAGCSAAPAPSRASPDDVTPSVAASPAWETVLELGPVTDVVVTGGAFESPGHYRLIARCTAPGRLSIRSDDGPFTFVCTSDGTPRTELVEAGRIGRTVVEVDYEIVSDWSVDVQVPAE